MNKKALKVRKSTTEYRTTVLRHLSGFLFAVFLSLIFILTADPEQGTTSNFQVLLYVMILSLGYMFGYFVFKPVYNAWINSKN